MLAGAAISLLSKLQLIVALCAYEAEYVAVCEAGKKQSGWDIYWLSWDFEKSLPRSHYMLIIKARLRS